MPIKYYESWCVQSEWVCGTREYIIQPMGTHSSLSHLQTLSHDWKWRKVFVIRLHQRTKYEIVDVTSIPHLMNGSRDIWEGPNMRIWTNIGRKEESQGKIFLISLVRTCHGPSQWVLMTLMAYGHYTETTWSGDNICGRSGISQPGLEERILA